MNTNKPIEAGYYALVFNDTHQTLEEAFPNRNFLKVAKDDLGKSGEGWLIADHLEHADLFFAYQVFCSGKVIVMVGDRNLRGNTPGEAYEKTLSVMTDGVAVFPVVFLQPNISETMH